MLSESEPISEYFIETLGEIAILGYSYSHLKVLEI